MFYDSNQEYIDNEKFINIYGNLIFNYIFKKIKIDDTINFINYKNKNGEVKFKYYIDGEIKEDNYFENIEKIPLWKIDMEQINDNFYGIIIRIIYENKYYIVK